MSAEGRAKKEEQIRKHKHLSDNRMTQTTIRKYKKTLEAQENIRKYKKKQENTKI